MKWSLFVGTLLALVAAPALGEVSITEAWVRGTVAGQMATGAFMQIRSSTDAALVSAASPAAKAVEIHEMALDAGVMRMRAIDRLALPAGKTVEMKPGGYHVMMMGLAAPLKQGDVVPFTLTFVDKDGRRSTQEIKVPVRALTESTPMPKH